MAWVRLDDKMPLSPKLRAVGMPAFGLHVLAICWSAHQEDDGKIYDADLDWLAPMYGVTEWRPLADSLVSAAVWARDGRIKGYRIQGFLDYNPSKADLDERRKKDRERKRNRLRGTTDSARNPDGPAAEPGAIP